MKISEVTVNTLLEFIHEEPTEQAQQRMSIIMASALAYIEGHTGISRRRPDNEGESLDNYEDLTTVYLIICQHMYDNRTLVSEGKEFDRVIDGIMSLHSRNLVG